MYAPALIVGDMIHVSGHVPWLEGGGFIQVTNLSNISSDFMFCRLIVNEIIPLSLNIASYRYQYPISGR